MRILYLDIDSLRPDHLGCYGYHRDTSPNIDALAKEGVRFTNYYATDTPCLPSRTAFFSGRCGLTTGVVNHGGVCADLPAEGRTRDFRSRFAQTTLGAVLREAGLWTARISPFPWRHSAYQVTYGFNETLDTGGGGLENADEILPYVADWLSRHGQQDDWFLHVNLWDPHTPYDTPESFGNPFAGDPIEDWITEELIQSQRKSFGPHSATELPGFEPKLWSRWRMGVPEIRNRADAKVHLDGYDTGIRYADHHLGLIFAQLKALGVWEETAIIVSADHGESQGELNVWGDHQTADQACNRIPLVVKWPGLAPGVAEGLLYHLDLPASLVAAVGGSAPPEWEGRPFLDDPVSAGRDHLILSQGAWSLQRSARWDRWLLIRTIHTGMKDFPVWMLFDLVADPHETSNLALFRPDLVSYGASLIDRFLEEKLPGAWRGDPFEIVLAEGGPYHANTNHPDWAKYVGRLRVTGRSEHADWLEKEGGRPRISNP